MGIKTRKPLPLFGVSKPLTLEETIKYQEMLFQTQLKAEERRARTEFETSLATELLSSQKQFLQAQKGEIPFLMQQYARKTKVERARMLELGGKWAQSQALQEARRRQRREAKKFKAQQKQWEKRQRSAFEHNLKAWSSEEATKWLLTVPPALRGQHQHFRLQTQLFVKKKGVHFVLT